MSKKKINKCYKLTKELFNELKEMCNVISYDSHNNFIKKYSKRKTIELYEPIKICLAYMCAAPIERWYNGRLEIDFPNVDRYIKYYFSLPTEVLEQLK